MATIMEALSQDLLRSDQVLVEALQQRGKLSVDDVIDLFEEKGIERPERSAKELVWEFVEKGKAKFNDDWLLEMA